MGLMKGGAPVEQQVQENAMTDEQQREMKRGLILYEARRKLRFAAIGFWLIMGTITFIHNGIFGNQSIGSAFVEGYLGYGIIAGILYLAIVWIFLYILANKGIQAYLFLKDLFGGSKETRL